MRGVRWLSIRANVLVHGAGRDNQRILNAIPGAIVGAFIVTFGLSAMLNAALPTIQRKFAIAVLAVALLPVAGKLAVHAWLNRAPDNWREVRSPDGHYRLVITEEGAGNRSGSCMKDMYVLPATRELDRADEDSHVFTGACAGLVDVNWSGLLIEARVDHHAARQGGANVMLRRAAAGGKIKVQWLP